MPATKSSRTTKSANKVTDGVTHEVHAALRDIRLARRLSQEDFAFVSGRTYVSELERGLRQPTLAKIDELAVVLGVHPMTVLALSYLPSREDKNLQTLFATIDRELIAMSLISCSGAPAKEPKALRRGDR